MIEFKKGNIVTYKGKTYEVTSVGYDQLFLFTYYTISDGDVTVSNVQNRELTPVLECV